MHLELLEGVGGTGMADIEGARDLLPRVEAAPEAIEALCAAAAALGVGSGRAPLLALRVARAAAALAGRLEVAPEDVALAARLVLGPRATQLPAVDEPEAEDDASQPEPPAAGR